MASPIRKVALTGGIASGKSLAGEYLRGKGIPVIDADDVVHRLLREDSDLKAKVRQEFGDAVFDPADNVIRAKLGELVFKSVPRRKLLESWIHPKTRERIEAFYVENHQAPLGVSIIPLLFESHLEDRYDEVWLLETDEATQMARLQGSRGMTESDAMARIRNQMPMADKLERARQCPCSAVIRNSGSPDDLFSQLNALLSRITDRPA